MRLSVIPGDRCIVKDGKAIVLTAETFPATDPAIHAIQWYTDHGTVEHTGLNGGSQYFTDPAIVAPYSAAFDLAGMVS